jgi:hypothetical protein
MIDQAFPSHGSLYPQLKVFVSMYGLSPMTCALQIAFYIPPYLLLLAYEFPKYIATQKNPVDHKLIY